MTASPLVFSFCSTVVSFGRRLRVRYDEFSFFCSSGFGLCRCLQVRYGGHSDLLLNGVSTFGGCGGT